MSIPLIRCRECEQNKHPQLFTPGDLRAAKPICRACRSDARFKTGGKRGSAWNGWAKFKLSGVA